jgi:hypothetical protein
MSVIVSVVMMVIIMSMYHRRWSRGNVSIVSMIVIGRRSNIGLIDDTSTSHKREHKCYE